MQIHHLTNKAIAVTGLPEGAYISGIQGRELYYWSSYGGYDIGDYPKSIHLPPGNWSILGRSAELTESQKAEYEPLLKAKGLHVSNPYSKPSMSDYSFPEDGPTDSMLLSVEHDFEFKYAEWRSAQLISNPLILIQ